jgi:hypothetical protein
MAISKHVTPTIKLLATLIKFEKTTLLDIASVGAAFLSMARITPVKTRSDPNKTENTVTVKCP